METIGHQQTRRGEAAISAVCGRLLPLALGPWWGLMRKVRRHRPLNRARATPPPGADLARLAERAKYVISTEHKDYLTEQGPGALRSDASPCPRDITRAQAEHWLREANSAGHVGAPWNDQSYPQYAWYRRGPIVFEARVTNVEQGWYKGYPLDPSEFPDWLP